MNQLLFYDSMGFGVPVPVSWRWYFLFKSRAWKPQTPAIESKVKKPYDSIYGQYWIGLISDKMTVVIYHRVMSWLSLRSWWIGLSFRERYWTLFGLPWWLWLKIAPRKPELWIHMNPYVLLGHCWIWYLAVVFPEEPYCFHVQCWYQYKTDSTYSPYEIMTVISAEIISGALVFPFWEGYSFHFGTSTFERF